MILTVPLLIYGGRWPVVVMVQEWRYYSHRQLHGWGWVRLNLPQTHCRSYRGWSLQVKWPNRQSTEGRWLRGQDDDDQTYVVKMADPRKRKRAFNRCGFSVILALSTYVVTYEDTCTGAGLHTSGGMKQLTHWSAFRMQCTTGAVCQRTRPTCRLICWRDVVCGAVCSLPLSAQISLSMFCSTVLIIYVGFVEFI